MAHDGGGLAVRPRKKPSPSPVVRQRGFTPPRPEISVGAPTKRPPTAIRRQPTVFARPIGNVSPVGPARGQARAQTRRAAQALPAEHQLPHFPALRHYSEPMRQVIRTTTERAVHRIAAERGEHPSDTVRKLYNEGDYGTRRTLRIYGRVVREQSQIAQSKALSQVAHAPVQADPAKLTQAERMQISNYGTVTHPQTPEGRTYVKREGTQSALKDALHRAGHLSTADRAAAYREVVPGSPTGQAKPGPKQKTGVGAVPLAAVQFLKDPNRNLFVAAAPGFKALGGNFVKDAISLPRDVVTSTAFAVQHPKAALHGFVNSDPLALAAQGRWKEAAIAFHEHPLNATLEVYGGVTGASRLAGRVRGVPIERAPAVRPGTAISVERTYTRSALGNTLQRKIEQRQIENAQKLYRQAQEAERSGEHPQEHVDEMYRHATEADPRFAQARAIEHRADVREALAQPAKRRGRAEVKAKVEPHLAEPSQGGHAQRLIVEGIAPVRRAAGGALDVKRMREDLAAYRNDLAKRESGQSGRKINANRKLRGRIDEALKLNDAQLTELATNSRSIAHITNDQEARNIALQQLHPVEALTSRVKPYAFRHMNAEVRVPSAAMDEWIQNPTGPPPEARLVSAADRRMTPKEASTRAGVLEAAADANRGNGVLASTLRAQAHRIRATRTERVYRALEPDQVLEHMKANGVDPKDIAFVSQREGSLGPGAFNVRSLGKDLTRKGLSTQTRTGAAVREGLLETHPSKLTANVVRLQQLEAADKNYVAGINEVAAREAETGKIRQFSSKSEGLKWAKNSAYDEHGNRIHGAPQWRIIRINPWGGREGQLAQLVEKGDPDGFLATEKGVRHPIAEAIGHAVSEHAAGDGPWAAVPVEWADRIAEHSEVYRAASPAMRAITGFFRNTVLPLSPTWLFGNVSEAALRAMITSPRLLHNVLTYRRVLAAIEAIDPEEAANIRDALGVGHYGMSEVSNTYISAAQFQGKHFRAFAVALSKLRHTHGPKEIADAYGKYTDFVFHTVNSRLETPFREAIAGHHIRQVYGDNMGRISEKAIRDAAKGLRNTNSQVRMADAVRRAYGQYEAFSPAQRKFIVLYSPFAAWSLNAVNFLGRVLPRDHPALTAALAAQNTAATQWREEHGLSEYGPNPVPPFLMGTVPVAGGHKNLARYTPFGFAGNPGDSFASLILPQFSGAIHALEGQKWTGDPLKHGYIKTTDRFKAMIEQQALSVVPVLSQVQRVVTKGPGTLSPLRTIPSGKQASSGSGFAWGGGGGSSSSGSGFAWNGP